MFSKPFVIIVFRVMLLDFVVPLKESREMGGSSVCLNEYFCCHWLHDSGK